MISGRLTRCYQLEKKVVPLTLNLTSANYSAHMTSWTKQASNMNGIVLKAAFSLVMMFEVVFESSEFFPRSSLRYIA